MALVLATLDSIGDALCYSGGSGVSAADVVIQTNNVARYDQFFIQSTGGVMEVLVTLDGTNYSTAPLSLMDEGATTTAPVLLTAANRTYSFNGCFRGVRVRQNGATAVANASMTCSRKGGVR